MRGSENKLPFQIVVVVVDDANEDLTWDKNGVLCQCNDSLGRVSEPSSSEEASGATQQG